MKYKRIKNFVYKRDIKLYKDEFNWDFKFMKAPYRKIKTIFNIELSSLILYFVYKTNLKPNHITLLGVLWILIGCFMVSSENILMIFLGLITFFTKRVLDIVDGSLAHLKNQFSKTGHELDLWAGEINKILLLTGFCIYIFNVTNNNIYLLILIVIILLNYMDPRKHLSSFKFLNITYKKKLKTHSQNIKKENNNLLNFLKFLNYDGRSNYTDLFIILIIIDINYNIINYLTLFPYLWLILNILVLFRSFKKVF